MSLNKCNLIGHIGNDFELKQTETTGMSVVNFRLATNTVWRDDKGALQQRTDWHNVVVWGSAADSAHATLKKGSHIYLEGSLQTSSYDREHKVGKRKVKIQTYVTEVVARDIKPLGMEAIASERVAA